MRRWQPMRNPIPYFYDYEFDESGPEIVPISMAMVGPNNRELYIEYQIDERRIEHDNPWVADNVLPHLKWPRSRRMTKEQAQLALTAFVLPPTRDRYNEFWAYNDGYDWVCLCKTFGMMVALPPHFPHHSMCLKQAAIMAGAPENLKPPKGPGQHDPIVDCRWVETYYWNVRRFKPMLFS